MDKSISLHYMNHSLSIHLIPKSIYLYHYNYMIHSLSINLILIWINLYHYTVLTFSNLQQHKSNIVYKKYQQQ